MSSWLSIPMQSIRPPRWPGRRPRIPHEIRRGARGRLPTPRGSIKSELVKQTIAKALHLAAESACLSPSPAPCSSRRGLPPADPALVQAVDDTDDVDPALDQHDGQPTVKESMSRHVSKVPYCRGGTPAECWRCRSADGRLSSGERICGRRS